MKFILHKPEKGFKNDIEIEFSLDPKTKDAHFFVGVSCKEMLYRAFVDSVAAHVIEVHGFELQNNGSYKYRTWYLRAIN